MRVNNKQSLPAITLTTIGIAYGDIGTSPIYTLRECLSGQFNIKIEQNTIFGFLSLIFWLLILVVSIKYLVFVMQADHSGEGGILTLVSIAGRNTSNKINSILVIIGLIGGSFFYGEVVITPAISVMSAIEGLELLTPRLNAWIVPISIFALTILFTIQKHGTATVGKLFAPIMIIWFIILAVLGLRSIVTNPYVLKAINPIWAIQFLINHKTISFMSLGTIVLSITGVEALYADIGHFGKLPIRIAWFIIVMPSLVLNYFGQGALILNNPEAIKNPFFLLAPDLIFIPMLIIATLATIIASQAVISGVFSLTMQAVRLGYLSPMKIIHTSEMEFGQIYIPFINWLLYFAVIIVIINFECSSKLAAAYGISVTGTMILTSILFSIVAYKNWHWSKLSISIILISFLCIDISLFYTNLDKITSGGWLSLILSLLMFIIMNTWKSERLLLLQRTNKYINSPETIISFIEKSNPVRVSGTAVYMSRTINNTPFALIYNLKHNKVLHKRVVLLTLCAKNVPYVKNYLSRVQIKRLSDTFWRVVASYGWRETPDIEEIFHYCDSKGLCCKVMESSFFISNESLVIGKRSWYLSLRGKLYIVLQRNALRAPDQFKIPLNRVIELGTQIEI